MVQKVRIGLVVFEEGDGWMRDFFSKSGSGKIYSLLQLLKGYSLLFTFHN